MAQSKATDKLIKLRCSTCKRFNYYTRRNLKKDPRKLDLSKYCKWCRKHTKHKEVKK